jgi:hypothetical protein
MKAKLIIITLLLAGSLWLVGCGETEESPSERDARMERGSGD